MSAARVITLLVSLTEICSRVRRIGGMGFNFIRQLTTDFIGRVFITDACNDRICVHDSDLNHLRNITLHSMSQPYDVKVSRDRIYVLCVSARTNPRGRQATLPHYPWRRDVLRPLFFCLDPLNNFVLSDCESHSIRVFSPQGNLLHTIGREGHQQGMFDEPQPSRSSYNSERDTSWCVA